METSNMESVYFYQPDGQFKYINDCSLWVIARLVDLVNEKKGITKWMEPMWLSAGEDQSGIGVYVSRIDAEINVQHMQKHNEEWKVYSLHDFNITQMMYDHIELTNQNTYYFMFSFGFWVDNKGALKNKNGCLCQPFLMQSFNIGRQYESREKIIIRFSKDSLDYINNAWSIKIKIMNRILKGLMI